MTENIGKQSGADPIHKSATYLKNKDIRFCIAPMMEWTDNI